MKCETISELERFLQIQEQALGAGAAEVAATASKLADRYLEAGLLERAEDLYKKALKIREALVGPHHEEADESKKSLARVVALKIGTPADITYTAADTESEAIVSNSSSSGAKFEARISSTNIEPIKRKSVPCINDAINDCKLEVELLRQMVGSNHPSLADILTKLADLYCRLRMYGEMEPLLIEALKIREATCGTNHGSVSTELKNLAHLYMAQERLYLAEPLLKRAIVIRQKTYGKMHPRVADIEESYIALLRKTNRVFQAEALESHVNEIRAHHSAETVASRRSTIFGSFWK